MSRGFGSDNHSGVHPELMLAIAKANTGHAPSYGTDEESQRSIELFRHFFGRNCEIFYVFNGTAANVLCLKAMMSSYHSALVSEMSHLNVDECGAPEFFTGGKLIPIKSTNGKISVDELEKAMIRKGDQHYSQAKVVSITQPTEYGTVYSLEEMKTISQWCKKNNLLLHLDGARFCNAVTALGANFSQLTTEIGVDILSFGGTKNGFLFGEAIVCLNPALSKDFKFLRKQAAQLPSKTRFVAVQFECYLKNDLWKEISVHECQMAEKLYQGLKQLEGIELTQPRQSNAVFAKIPKNIVKKLREHYFFYVWDESTFECRLMTSWDTQESDIDGFVKIAKGLL